MQGHDSARGAAETIVARPEIQVELERRLPPCASTSDLPVRGEARATDGVARIAYSLNGAPDVEPCTTCGVTAPFAFTATLQPGETIIRTTAVSTTGLAASAETRVSLIPEASAIEFDPLATPLRVERAPGDLVCVSWQRSAATSHPYEGVVASPSRGAHDHVAIAPCPRPESEAVSPRASADTYYLVTWSCAGREGSYGRDSFGRERPVGTGCN